jgi:conflict system pore-forming effector with SLATT domain
MRMSIFSAAVGALVAGAVWIVTLLLRKNNNIEPARESLDWQCADPSTSLTQLKKYVEDQATSAANWYFAEKKWKARWSSVFRLAAIILTALSGLIPVLGQLMIAPTAPTINPLWSSLLVGIAAALVGVDRAFGFSSGWTRYVLAATAIRKSFDEFRMDWEALTAKSACPTPTADQVAAFVQRAKDFRLAVEGIVQQETQEWATEFQSNTAQLEKDVKAQLDSLKAQVDKAQAANRTGWIELTVLDADKLQGSTFKVTLENSEGAVIAQEQVTNSKKWIRLNVRPGTYRITINGTSAAGTGVSTQIVATIKADEGTAPPDITLA